MSHATPRSTCAITAIVALSVAACGDKAPHRGWTRPFDAADAAALVATCLPGAEPTMLDAPRRSGWRLADPGPPGWLTFGISYSFEWKTEEREQLLNVAIEAAGPKDQETPDNSARYRAALACAVAGLPMPPKVGAKAFDLLAAIRPPGSLGGKRDGFDLIARIGEFSSSDFHAAIYIFGR